jgi:DNA polymerase I
MKSTPMSGAYAEYSTDWQRDFTTIWHVDFEYRESANHLPILVCMFAYEQHTGATIELWRDQLLQYRRAPFDAGPHSLMVAYAVNAELSCFLALGWPFPRNTLDLYTETIAAINGDTDVWPQKKRPGLLAAIELHGLTGMSSAEKKDMRQVILDHSEYSHQQRTDIQAYNRADVEATLALLGVMAPAIDLPRALHRGRYMGAAARMEQTGIPID